MENHLSKAERGRIYGVANQNLRKLVSSDDSGASSGDTQKASDALLYSVYAKKQRISLNYILEDHGLYASFSMNNNFQYIITLPAANQILLAQSAETLGSYSLDNLQLEYETIENLAIANRVSSMFSIGRSLSYTHVTLMKTTQWAATSTLINENINVPRKSMCGVVLLFTKGSQTDSENYVFPNITEVKITVEGVPNMIYSRGIQKSKFFEEAKRFFGLVDIGDQFLAVDKLCKDKFGLVIDLRTHMEQLSTGHGKKL